MRKDDSAKKSFFSKCNAYQKAKKEKKEKDKKKNKYGEYIETR